MEEISALCGKGEDSIQHLFGDGKLLCCEWVYEALKLQNFRVRRAEVSLATVFGLNTFVVGRAPCFDPYTVGRWVYSVWLAHTHALIRNKTPNPRNSVCYWSLTAAVLNKTTAMRTNQEKARETTLAALLREPTGVTGGKPPEPRTWIPEMMHVLGFTKWHIKCPDKDTVIQVLYMYRAELDVESKEYKVSLRWEWLLAGFLGVFFEALAKSVADLLSIA